MNRKYIVSLMTTLVLAGPLVHSTVVDASQNLEDSESQQLESFEKEKTQLKEDITDGQANMDELVINIGKQEEVYGDIKEEIRQSQKEIRQLEEQLEQRNDASPNIDARTSVEDLTQSIGRMGDVNNLVSSNRDILLEQIKDQKKLEKAEEQMKHEQKELESVEEQLEVSRVGVINQRADLDDKIIEIAEKFEMTEDEKEEFIDEQTIIAERTSSLNEEMKAEKQRILEEEREKEEAVQLAEEIRKKEAKEAAEAEADKKEAKEKAETEADVSTSSSDTENESESSGWTRPANGRLSSPFGYRTHPVTGEQGSFHGGIDIAGGGSVVAARAGTVTSASYSDTYGYTVIVDHGGGYSTLYAHLKAELSVSNGQTVLQGQQLGIMGTTGRSTGVHLHFEIRKDGTAADPMNYIK